MAFKMHITATPTSANTAAHMFALPIAPRIKIKNFTNKANIILNEESIDYKWCKFDEFIEQINWFGDKQILEKVLNLAIKKHIFFREEKIDKL